MKLTVEIEYKECLAACLDYARKQTEFLSKIECKQIDVNELFNIIRTSSDIEDIKSKMARRFGFGKSDVARILDIPLADIANNIKQLEYYRTSVEVLSKLVGEKANTDSNTSYVELVTH